jgi:choline kinase
MWLALDHMRDGALVLNGDTVHPVSVEHALLAARGPQLLLALDTEKVLAHEEMKVQVDDSGALTRITKLMDPALAYGEYIGASLIEGSAVPALADALRFTWETDPDRYYEDGYQVFVDRGGVISTAAIPSGTSWVEVDDHRDLDRARSIALHY